jgi:hypothetical protein
MKVASLVLVLVGSANAFTSQPFGVSRPNSALSMAGETVVDRALIRKSISKLDKDNFSSTLELIEPFLLNEAGATTHAKSMRRIGRAATALGVEVPSGFAKAAKATEKRREKQDAFIKIKVEEAAAAAEEATAAAAAAAEEAAAAAAEPVAEEAAVEEPAVEEVAAE